MNRAWMRARRTFTDSRASADSAADEEREAILSWLWEKLKIMI